MPKVVDHQQRRTEVAEAVWRLLGRKGFEGLTVRNIAGEAGCSTGVLAHYFPDKDALLIFALRLASEREGKRMLRAAKIARGTQALRDVLYEALPLDDARRLEWNVWMTFWGQAVANPVLQREHSLRHTDWRRLLRMVLMRAQEEGELRKDFAPTREADGIAAFIDGLGLHAMIEPDYMTVTRMEKQVDRYLARLRAPEIARN